MGHPFQVGDWVTFLDEVGEGKVISVRGEDVEVLAGEFTRVFLAQELIHRDEQVMRWMAQTPVNAKGFGRSAQRGTHSAFTPTGQTRPHRNGPPLA